MRRAIEKESENNLIENYPICLLIFSLLHCLSLPMCWNSRCATTCLLFNWPFLDIFVHFFFSPFFRVYRCRCWCCLLQHSKEGSLFSSYSITLAADPYSILRETKCERDKGCCTTFALKQRHKYKWNESRTSMLRAQTSLWRVKAIAPTHLFILVGVALFVFYIYFIFLISLLRPFEVLMEFQFFC